MNTGSGLLAPVGPVGPSSLLRSAGPAGPAPHGPAGPRPARPGTRSAPEQSRPVSEAHLEAMVRAFVVLYLEVEAGRRSRRQLQPLVHPRLAAALATVWVRPGARGHVHQIAGSRTAPDRFEAVAVVRRDHRYGAVAVGLQRFGGHWRVVDAARPEDGRLPAPAFWVGPAAEWDAQPDPFAASGVAGPIG